MDDSLSIFRSEPPHLRSTEAASQPPAYGLIEQRGEPIPCEIPAWPENDAGDHAELPGRCIVVCVDGYGAPSRETDPTNCAVGALGTGSRRTAGRIGIVSHASCVE